MERKEAVEETEVMWMYMGKKDEDRPIARVAEVGIQNTSTFIWARMVEILAVD